MKKYIIELISNADEYVYSHDGCEVILKSDIEDLEIDVNECEELDVRTIIMFYDKFYLSSIEGIEVPMDSTIVEKIIKSKSLL